MAGTVNRQPAPRSRFSSARCDRGTAVATRWRLAERTTGSVRERIPRDALRLNLIYVARCSCSLPCWSTDGSARASIVRAGEKFRGKAPLRIGDQPCLWFHAVSVGEVLLLRPLVVRWPGAGRTGRS